jgi:hypothetical protein
MRPLILLPLVLACGGKAAAPPRSDAGAAALVAPEASRDGGPIHELDAAPIAPADVLEGRAAQVAMAEARRPDAGAAQTGLRASGAGPFELGMTAAEVLPHLAGQPLRPQRVTADQPERSLGRAFENGLPWIEVELVAGRVVAIRVLARSARALSEEGVGVGSSMGEAVVAHGAPRPVVRAGKLLGWVLADLPGVLVETSPPGAPPPGEGAREDAPDGGVADGARIRVLSVLGPEALADED